MMSYNTVGSVVRDVLEGLRHKSDTIEHKISKALSSALSKKEQDHVKVSAYRKEVLFIKVSNSAWLYEIVSYRKDDILSHMRETLGDTMIRDIRYSIK